MDERAHEEGEGLCGFGGDVRLNISNWVAMCQRSDECRMIVIAVLLLNIFHPGKYLFRRKGESSSPPEELKSDV